MSSNPIDSSENATAPKQSSSQSSTHWESHSNNETSSSPGNLSKASEFPRDKEPLLSDDDDMRPERRLLRECADGNYRLGSNYKEMNQNFDTPTTKSDQPNLILSSFTMTETESTKR